MSNIDFLPVAPNRRLFRKEHGFTENGIDELFDLENEQHLMQFRGRPDQWEQYRTLQEAGIELPQMNVGEQSPERFELIIPLGAKSIASQLGMIKRDVVAYADVMFELGEYFADVHDKTGLIPIAVHDRGLLSSTMMYDSQTSASGVGMLLVPPFYLTQKRTSKKVYTEIEAELRGSNVFTAEEIEYLAGAFEVGLSGVTREY